MIDRSVERCPRCGARIEYCGRIGIDAYDPTAYRCSNPWCPNHGEKRIGPETRIGVNRW